jgi:hypothetical protein
MTGGNAAGDFLAFSISLYLKIIALLITIER